MQEHQKVQEQKKVLWKGDTVKVAMIGIGDIAQKAYLPVMSVKKDIEIILCSRNEALLQELCGTYKGITYVTNMEALFEAKVEAAFVHAATEAHYGICKKLMEHHIPVYVDKPVSYHATEVAELYDIAERNHVIFRTGFNRRRVPFIREMSNLASSDVIIYQKNRELLPADIRHYIFDDFIHVVDTMRFLQNETIKHVQVQGKIEEGQLVSVTIQLIGENGVAIGIMNRESGKAEERIEYICPGEKWTLEDLDRLTIYKDGVVQNEKYDDWTPILYRRGFEQITDKFLRDIGRNHGFMEEDRDSILTHEICETIVSEITRKLQEEEESCY